MSHLTRCPACGTTFRVVDDQLRLADGWVRCGACQHVYDALPGLQDEPSTQPPMADATHAVPTLAPAWVEEPIRATEPEPEPVSESEPAPGLADAKPTFVRQAERRAFWRRPLVRLGLGLTTLLLALVLVAQAAWGWRDHLATRWPATQPWLAQLCLPLGCTVGAPRVPQALRIDSSALIRQEGSRYRFELVVKNDATHAVAAPDLELTLLDATQTVRLQRVLPAADWPGAKAQLSAGETWSVRFEFDLLPAVADRMAGYRAWLFYL